MLLYKIKILFKRRRHNKSRYSANKIYVSRTEVKHTNNKLLIILYIYNKQKLSIERRLRKIITVIRKKKIFNKQNGNNSIKNRIFYSLKNRFILLRK